MVNKNLCPVCGYGMEDPPRDYNICPCCGTEFGVSDANSSTEALRAAWVAGGAHWWSSTDPEPSGWNAAIQLAGLLNLDLIVYYDTPEIKTMGTSVSSSTLSVPVPQVA